MSTPDKIRLHFWHEGEFYEKYIVVDYPKEIVDSKMFRVSYGMEALESWYQEITGLTFQSKPVNMRDIRYSRGTAEEAILNLDSRN